MLDWLRSSLLHKRAKVNFTSFKFSGIVDNMLNHVAIQIFVTVGTDGKRDYLYKSFSMAQDHICSSRNSSFVRQILQRTDGRGVNVILNSLTGGLFDESWRLLADGGVLAEIGKRAIVQRNRLAMEPFDRNCTFRALDLSYVKEITEELIDRQIV